LQKNLAAGYSIEKEKRRKRIFRKEYGARIWMKGKERRMEGSED